MSLLGWGLVTIHRLNAQSITAFEKAPEVFSGVHLGQVKWEGVERYSIVVGGLVSTIINDPLAGELADFYRKVWTPESEGTADPTDATERYVAWLGSLTEITVQPVPVTRFGLAANAALTNVPPPPPGRLITPVGPHPPGGPPNVYGHLPFQTTTRAKEIFWRFEAWPTSQRLLDVSGVPTIRPGTFASPRSELRFLPTGFSAVARNALPSFFPACFRYRLTPAAKTHILCGAVIPMYGQSGGGVEVMFDKGATNSISFSSTVVPPL